ncbi:MAG: tRNA1(Val) (adenine(37)-N6)-methyltransferase [Cetobacterium somerae]|uniref:tRNA1(Val) (adenine(37)-N6)-methyltransferase n=1 Tax=Cetobacterium TaxID=180162 RepID=UPI00163D0BCD|nr:MULTISPECIES: methyltransferase [Cetobacterium]MBC2853979.1 tRNA (adenine(22)-N(1))-methyltransferase TrmK [Cetobacterium sp. 2G large]MCQ9626062.1 tRNA (adenine(22)-N(1))-methyltransferase TrmK [Cetobacterium somerae]WVJ00435.1 methyltransferase [Cetobacterium somerae]
MIFENEDIANIYEGYTLIQKKEGFRFGTDAVLLANFFNGKKNSKILEIGTGNGIIPVLLCAKDKISKIKAVEIQKEIADLAIRNVKRNGLEDRIEVVNMDIKNIQEGNTYDYIISNPPYMVLDGKEINDKDIKSIARHEIKLNLKEFIANAKRLLKPRGELFMVHKSYRFLEISEELIKNGFSVKRVKFVHYSKDKDSSIVLIEASKGRKNILKIETPIFLNDN